ncbi:hypothetical protein [Natrinema amylolyticum]|uniref:hypothetical protein n=1 Tax=Natrinema amylolyticum TaxID=2878679 RepID=UPI001CFC23B0|nr:hypothetical protein [Natrinema amylolyticum]
MTDQQKGDVQHVSIYQCHPQADDPWWELYEEISADELDNYENTKDIVRGFMGNLEKKQYKDPSIKNARKHELEDQETQSTLNELSTFHLNNAESDVNSPESEAEEAEEAEEVEEDDDTSTEENNTNDGFSNQADPLIEKYEKASNSVDCFLLFIEYSWESDRFESENRLMIVQLPLREDVFIPGEDNDEDAEELFSNLQDAFDDTLKKSILYPFQGTSNEDRGSNSQDDSENETNGGEGTDEDEDNSDGESLGVAYLYQRNGQAQYWHEFLDLQGVDHKDEILAEQRIDILKQVKDDETDNEDIEDPFAEIDSLADVDQSELQDNLEKYWDSGIVIEIGNFKIQGFTVGQVLEQDPIDFYENTDTGEIFTVIRGQEPAFRPVGKGTYRQSSNGEEEGEEEEDETIDISLFPDLSEYKNLDDILDDR